MALLLEQLGPLLELGGGEAPFLGHMGCMGEIVLEIKLGLCGKGWREEWMLSRQSPMSEASELHYLHN